MFNQLKALTVQEIKPHHNATHGMTDSSEFASWSAMKTRCSNPNTVGYHRYGGRGITVCDRWMNSFENFYQDMGPKPTELHTIERMNNDGNYEPDNCKWATKKEQAFNKSTTVFVETDEKQIINTEEAAEKYSLNRNTLYSRLRSNIPLDQPVLQHPSYNAVLRYPYNGRELTVQEICEETGIAAFNLRYHLRDGKTVEEALEVIDNYNHCKHVYNGKNYTVTGLARLLGVTHATLNVRLKAGQSVEEAVKGITDTKNIAKYFYKGETLSINELAKKTGYQTKPLRRHLNRGKTVEEAIRIIDFNKSIRTILSLPNEED